MATFNAASHQVRADYNFVSALSMHKPDKGDKLYKPLGNQLLTDILNYVQGGSAPATSLEYSHFEEDWIMPKIKATTAGAGAGASATFTIDATADLEVNQAASPYGGSLTTEHIPVRVNDLILIKPSSGVVSASSYIRAIVTSVTVGSTAGTSTFAARPLNSTLSIPAIASAAEIVIYGNGFGEGSDQPKGLNSKVTEYKNQLQTIKETFQRTGIEGDMVMWVPVTDSKGNKGWVWRIKGEDDAWKRFLNFREMVMIMGEKVSNTALQTAYATANEPLSLTEGLVPFALGGVVQNYNSVGGLTITDLEDMARELNKNKGAMENMILCGFDLSVSIDNLLRDSYTAGAIQFGNYSFDQNAKANFMFDSFKIGGYTFHKKTFDAFNDLQGFGADGYGFTNEGIVIPMDERMDAKSGEMVPSLRKRYLADSQTFANKEFDVTLYDGFRHGDAGKDVMEVRYKSYCGFEGFGQNRFGYIKQV